MKKIWIIAAIVSALLLTGAIVFKDEIVHLVVLQKGSSSFGKQVRWSEVETLARDLYVPWSLAFLPNGDMLVTQRDGVLKRIGKKGQVYTVRGVEETSEGGLLGIALHPKFAENKFVYLYLTTNQNGRLINRVDRYVLQGDDLKDRRVMVSDIPAANNHNGGGIAFGPDGKLYVTTGDAAQRELAQATWSLAGKILRMNDDGTVPRDNPFGNLVWSYGHRNPQGITWDDQGRMWSVEHGPSGEWKGRGKDELNQIEKGANYGWPMIAGDEKAKGMKSPVLHSGENMTWAPSGIAFINGSLFFAGLRGETLYHVKLNDNGTVRLTSHYAGGEFGRLRAVATRGKYLYFTTSNLDGRGAPREHDDKILRIRVEP